MAVLRRLGTPSRVAWVATLAAVVWWAVIVAKGPGSEGPTAAVLAPFLETFLAMYAVAAIWILVAVYSRTAGGRGRRAAKAAVATVVLLLAVMFGGWLLAPLLLLVAVAVNLRGLRRRNGRSTGTSTARATTAIRVRSAPRR